MVQNPEHGSSRPREALPLLQNPAASSIPRRSQLLCFTTRISNFPKAPEGTPGGSKQHLECWEFPEGVQSYELKCWGFTFHTVFTAKLMVCACPSRSCQQPAQFFPSGQHTSPLTAAVGTQLSILSWCVLRCSTNPLGFGALLCAQAL